MSCCRQHQEKLEELTRLRAKLELEMEARTNREMQIVELEQTLAKESERAADLKVRLLSLHSIAAPSTRDFVAKQRKRMA